MTLAGGNLSEVFFSSLDRPVLHSLRFIAAAAGAPPVDDAIEGNHVVRWIEPGIPAFTVESAHPEYRLSTEYIVDPDSNAILIAGTFLPELPDVELYLQAVPHLIPGSAGNDAQVVERDPPLLLARQGDVWFAVVGPFEQATAGYFKTSDLEVDLHDNEGVLTGRYSRAQAGNVAVGARIGIQSGPFHVAVGFAHSKADAEEVARRALARGSQAMRTAFEEAWRKLPDLPRELTRVTGDEGALARCSVAVLRSLEDKNEPGAFIAAPCSPWGELNHDGNHIYHLVWPRDLYHITTGLMAAGDAGPAERAFRYLAKIQRPDGSWPQNCWINGQPHWHSLELDEVAFPILLAWRLKVVGRLDHDPYQAVIRPAAAFLVTRGPSTPLDRWEDGGGLSPSSLAAMVAALIAAAEFAAEAGEHVAAAHMRDVADYWCDRLEAWCFSEWLQHYVRVANDPDTGPDPDASVAAEFLEAVRRGLRPADHPLVVQSLSKVDRHLKVKLPGGPGWRRYTGDSYGESENGAPWNGHGQGRAWPLLTGERGHHALAWGQSAAEHVNALESFSGGVGLLPEQVWDGPEVPGRHLRPGSATGSARPLGWAHAEYLRLLAALATADLPDVVGPAFKRYCEESGLEPAFFWTKAHPITRFQDGRHVKIQLAMPGIVRWTPDRWRTFHEVETVDTTLGVWVADLPTQIMRPDAVMEWTVQYADGNWEGRNYALTCFAARPAGSKGS
jgi:glucoamylase